MAEVLFVPVSSIVSAIIASLCTYYVLVGAVQNCLTLGSLGFRNLHAGLYECMHACSVHSNAPGKSGQQWSLDRLTGRCALC